MEVEKQPGSLVKKKTKTQKETTLKPTCKKGSTQN